jgi:hypothetical protein
MTHKTKLAKLFWVNVAVLLSLIAGGLATQRSSAQTASGAKILGLKQVIAFTYTSKDFNLKGSHSATLVGPLDPADWKEWRDRGVVLAVGVAWPALLRVPIAKAVDTLVGPAYGGNPKPVVMIDEFGFDYGGLMDEKSAQILRLAKRQKPELSLVAWEMRGPIPKVLGEAYRDAADLVMMESYMGDKSQYWWVASQVWSARRFGILAKTIVVLGVGKGGNPGEDWAQTKEELEQQIRFVRLIAPESPGVGFFSGTPELLADADAVCARFADIPTDGSGLPAETLKLAQVFSSRHEKPTLVAFPDFVEPGFTEDGQGFVQPKTLRAYLINLGDQDARNVKVRLRNPADQGGNVFAEGVVPLIPKRGETVGVLPVTGQWKVWVGKWDLEIDAPGCEVLTYRMSR